MFKIPSRCPRDQRLQNLKKCSHYSDVIMTTIASQITSLTVVHSIVYSYQRKYKSSASLAFVRGIHRPPGESPHKGPVTRKMFPFDDVTMQCWYTVHQHCVHGTITVPVLGIAGWLAFVSRCWISASGRNQCQLSCILTLLYSEVPNKHTAPTINFGLSFHSVWSLFRTVLQLILPIQTCLFL